MTIWSIHEQDLAPRAALLTLRGYIEDLLGRLLPGRKVGFLQQDQIELLDSRLRDWLGLGSSLLGGENMNKMKMGTMGNEVNDDDVRGVVELHEQGEQQGPRARSDHHLQPDFQKVLKGEVLHRFFLGVCENGQIPLAYLLFLGNRELLELTLFCRLELQPLTVRNPDHEEPD